MKTAASPCAGSPSCWHSATDRRRAGSWDDPCRARPQENRPQETGKPRGSPPRLSHSSAPAGISPANSPCRAPSAPDCRRHWPSAPCATGRHARRWCGYRHRCRAPQTRSSTRRRPDAAGLSISALSKRNSVGPRCSGWPARNTRCSPASRMISAKRALRLWSRAASGAVAQPRHQFDHGIGLTT